MKMNICLLYYDVERVPVCSAPLTYNEILKINKKAMDKRAYSLVKTLESLPKFTELIKEIRVENLHIPEGSLGWEKLRNDFNENHTEGTLGFLRAYDGYVENAVSATISGVKFRGVELIKKTDKDADNTNEVNYQKIVSLDTFYSNLELGTRKIYQEFALPDSMKEPLKLIILHEAILVPFSGKLDKFYVSDRDLRIVELKKTMKHRDIADLFAQEFGDYSINEDQIKHAYNIAIDKISLLQKSEMSS